MHAPFLGPFLSGMACFVTDDGGGAIGELHEVKFLQVGGSASGVGNEVALHIEIIQK